MSRAVILRDFTASPDHNHTRLYTKGEMFEVGSTLMPQGLVDALLGQYVPSGRLVGLVSLEEVEQKVSEPCIRVEEKSISKEMQEANTEAHNKLFENRRVMDW